MTLKEVFESLNLTAYDLTVDMLDVHAVRQKASIRICIGWEFKSKFVRMLTLNEAICKRDLGSAFCRI